MSTGKKWRETLQELERKRDEKIEIASLIPQGSHPILHTRSIQHCQKPYVSVSVLSLVRRARDTSHFHLKVKLIKRKSGKVVS